MRDQVPCTLLRALEGTTNGRAGEAAVSSSKPSNHQGHEGARRKQQTLACIVQASGNSVDGRAKWIFQFPTLTALLFAAQEFDLNQAHRINVWIAQADGAGEDSVSGE